MKKWMMIAAIPAALALTAMTTRDNSPVATGSGTHVDTLRLDPVCGMKVDDAKHDTAHYQGQVFAFCSGSCKKDFKAEPSKFWPRKN